MGSETDEVVIEDSDDSLLDIKELNDVEFDLPSVTPPSLETILWDMESEEGSDNTSLHSLQSLTVKLRSMLHHCILQGISSQVSSAGERVGAGLPTVITNSTKFIAVGTSHGYVLTFDCEQKLCWCSHDVISNDQGAISALAFNVDSTRLLVGFERGYILMLDALNGDVLRRLPDAHAPQTAVLQLRFTAMNNLALVGDSSGCVFSINFTRTLGVRSWDSKCLFSGARGEVCCFEPIVHGQDLLGHNIIVALATLSKVIVITIKPHLRVLFSQQLPRVPTSLPLLTWHLVIIGKSWQPVLAWGRGSELNYTRVVFSRLNRNRLKLSPLLSTQLTYTITGIHWIGSRHLAILDTSENLRLIEVRTQKELEVLELTSAGLVYGSAAFKALAVGGGVSEAFALAGERACYNSITSHGDQLFVLGTKAVHMIKLRTWHERLVYLSEQGRWAEALNLAADEGLNREKSTASLLEKYLSNLGKHCTDKESLTAAINCCVKLYKIDILCNELYETISTDHYNEDLFYTLITEHICNGALTYLSPSVTQGLVTFLEERDLDSLKNVLLSLELICLDLHQVLSICKKRKLYDAWIHITTKTICDYTSPLTEFLLDLTPSNHSLGNTMLVYVSACLAGLGYPKGNIPPDDVVRAKYDVLRCLEAVHSVNAKHDEQNYPYLRALLKYNIRECLNVIKLAFTENEFSGEMGLLQRQRLVEILMQIVTPPEFNDSQITVLSCFISKLITTNNLKMDESMLDTVIKSLTDIVGNLSQRDHSEREQAWLDLLNAGKLNHLNCEELLKTALESGCYRVAEFVFEKKKKYKHILQCYLKDPIRKSEVFSYILMYVNVPNRCIREQFLVNFTDIVAIDPKRCVDIIVEHFADDLEQFYRLVVNDQAVLGSFLSELVISDLKIPPEIAEKYLEVLCMKNDPNICVYLQTGHCRVEQALEITQKYNSHLATSLLLEETGEYKTALELLLNNNLIDTAIDVCIRGADHLDAKSSQELWLMLLKHPKSCQGTSLRQLLHSAAPHVPPTQLMELISDASFGDVKVILEGMLSDCAHDVQVLQATFRLLDKDLHQGLAKMLCSAGKGVSISKFTCNMCQTSLLRGHLKPEDEQISIWGCGHTFHSGCVSKEDNFCPFCNHEATFVDFTKAKAKQKPERKQVRPDVEGHF